ncbi:D-alanine--poly(phosphoribitol) ligase [Algimonas ampicilliniresistens]|uniref:D-alanine--poly(Phosphoribitol) ligase n=1 Tax=Algimonas ampicilliniresistens TaxID=1298735 RepID=A0ABQ5VB83_9PROT|nr:amino acid adenylation domain-containing protein [Algimonas ampicilliniresistens]GLQ24690.1 D-alanine--poly(phosphoribitol) ligase [Algimonas ampicilliniresistens]
MTQFETLNEAADNLCLRIHSVAQRHGKLDALWVKGKTLSYAELHSRACAIANALRSHGIKEGDRVALFSHRTEMLYISVLGVLYAGATYVAMNPRYPAARNRMILELSGARGLIIAEALLSDAPDLTDGLNDLRVVIAPESETGRGLGSLTTIGKEGLTETDRPALHDVDSDSLAYIMFTSGSTGKPKGVPISHGNVIDYVTNVVALGGPVEPGEKVIQLADVTFDISVHDMFYAWTQGASIISIPENSGLMATRFVEEHGITHWFSVPSTARLLGEAGVLKPGSLSTIRCSFFCGEPLIASVATRWREAVGDEPVYNLYGPTEGTVAISGRRFRTEDFDPHEVVSLGTVFGDNRMELFDPETNAALTDPSAIGEICLSGAQITPGYWRNDGLNAQRFFTDDCGRRWYKTGDLGLLTDDKGLVFSGRVDHQVKIRGYRVELSEIEGVIRESTGAGSVAVLPWPLSSDGAPLGCVAFLPMAESDVLRASIRKACDEKLPDYMRPSEVYFLDELPRNANGKTDYKALEKSPLLF